MPERGPSEAAKARCDRLASLLARPEGIRWARRLQAAGRFDRPVAAAPPESTAAGADRPRPISIWRPRRAAGELVFERPRPLPLGDHYAARCRLPAAKAPGSTRVCFFGESAAAGYLYAPHLTPAGVLEEQLGAVVGDGAYEVIDLARTNERIDTLVETLESSLQLTPDLLVIFTGNNWNLLETPELSPHYPSVRARQRYARLLRQAPGLAGPVDRAGRARLARAAAAMARIARLADAHAIPVVVIVPEVNLADWESRQPPPWLPGDRTARWHRHYEEARRLLDAGDFADAARLAHEMLHLDGGLCPTSYRLLARAWLGQGRRHEAAEACRAEVAAAQYPALCFLGAPQATPDAQELLRRAGGHHGFSLVDLPRVFAEHTGSPLPDRRLFLDYCHLTIEGIQVAMAATAAAILGLAEGRELDWRELVEQPARPAVAPEADATAKLGAAVHGAHRLLPVGPKAPILEHWCREALAACPNIAETMWDFIAARSSPLPAVLTAAQKRNYRSPFRLSLQQGWRYDHLDVDAIEAMVATLEEAGHRARARAESRILAGRGLGGGAVDLVHPAFYLREPLERPFAEVFGHGDGRRATYRAAWPVSRFCLPSANDHDLEIELRARLSPAELEEEPEARAAAVRVSVNGRPAGRLELSSRWRRTTIGVARSLLRDGLNEIELRWPPLSRSGDEALEAAVRRLELGLDADLHPIFGEVFSLIVRGAPAA